MDLSGQRPFPLALCPLGLVGVFLLSFGASSLVLAQELFQGHVSDGTYSNEQVGWKMSIPSGWKILNKAEIARVEGVGLEAFEETAGTEIQPDHTPLLYLSKDQFNHFTASSAPHDRELDGDYALLSDELSSFMLEVYKNEGLDVEYAKGQEQLAGLTFYTLNLTILAPDGSGAILHQKLFDGLVRDDLGVTFSITVNNEDDKQVILEALQSSSFSR